MRAALLEEFNGRLGILRRKIAESKETELISNPIRATGIDFHWLLYCMTVYCDAEIQINAIQLHFALLLQFSNMFLFPPGDFSPIIYTSHFHATATGLE